MDIAAWLRSLDLEQYEPAFRANDVDAGVLPRLTSEDLKDIGVTSVGHRRKLLDAITVLQGEANDGGQALPVDHVSAPQQLPPAAAEPSAERRQLTIIFVDLVASSAMSGRLDPGADARGDPCLSERGRREITLFEGHVAKYMGDGRARLFRVPAGARG
jgi:hypothetical protein